VGDFNGDGRPDLAVADQLGDTVSVLLGKGDGSFAFPPAVYPAGQSPSALAAGDFNGDGLPDLAVANRYAGTVSVLLNGAGTRAAFASSAGPTVFGQPVTFTATVTPTLAGAGTPSGRVTFFDGATALGSAPLDAGGHARLTTAALAPGGHAITATYGGD